jgi:hypothetical protein
MPNRSVGIILLALCLAPVCFAESDHDQPAAQESGSGPGSYCGGPFTVTLVAGPLTGQQCRDQIAANTTQLTNRCRSQARCPSYCPAVPHGGSWLWCATGIDCMWECKVP